MSPGTRVQRASVAMLSASQLRRRYIVALSLIAILAIVSQILMQFLIADQKYDSRVINIAGRQRMLSQKITKLSYHIFNPETPDAASRYRKDLAEAVSLWERSHAGLLKGDREMGLPGRNSYEVITLFGRIQPHYESIVTAAKAILSPSPSAATLSHSIRDITDHEADFLKDTLLRHAGQAMYVAKQSGKNLFYIYNQARDELSPDLQKGLVTEGKCCNLIAICCISNRRVLVETTL